MTAWVVQNWRTAKGKHQAGIGFAKSLEAYS